MSKKIITEDQVVYAYALAKDVFYKKLKQVDAAESLTNSYGMSSASAGHYINNINMMLHGKGYKRTMNPYATEYYLARIKEEFDDSIFQGALDALADHLEYYSSLQKGSKQKAHQSILQKFRSLQSDQLYPDEISIEDESSKSMIYKEGSCKKIMVNAYERCIKARKACISKYGTACSVCEFDFSQVYGDIGNGFIHVHHLIELSSIKTEYKINPEEDLRPVCPNCHAMLHRKKPAMSIGDLIKIREKQRVG